MQGPVGDIVIEPEMLDITLPAGAVFSHTLPSGHTAFAYILSGEGCFDDQRELHQPETVLLFEHAGETIQVASLAQALRFLLISGKPLNEPIAWQGPIVMNTHEELRIAFEEYQRGTFVK